MCTTKDSHGVTLTAVTDVPFARSEPVIPSLLEFISYSEYFRSF